MRLRSYLLIIMFVLFCREALGQFSGLEAKIKLNISNDKIIGAHWSPTIAIYFPIYCRLCLKIGMEYTWEKTYWQSYEQEFRGINYHGKNAQLFNSNSLHFGIMLPITTHCNIATSCVGELLKVKRVVYNSDRPFILWANDRVEPDLIEHKDILLFRPGISLESTIKLPIMRSFSMIIGACNTTIFIPPDLLMNKQRYLNSFGLSCGFLWKF